jgi:hypothetical protein
LEWCAYCLVIIVNCFVRFGDVWFVSALKAEICVACKEFTNTNTPFRLGEEGRDLLYAGKAFNRKDVQLPIVGLCWAHAAGIRPCSCERLAILQGNGTLARRCLRSINCGRLLVRSSHVGYLITTFSPVLRLLNVMFRVSTLVSNIG